MPMTLRSSPLRPALLRNVFALALVALVAGSGCARMKGMFKDEDKNEGLPVSQLYDKAHGYMEQGRWSSAGETCSASISPTIAPLAGVPGRGSGGRAAIALTRVQLRALQLALGPYSPSEEAARYRIGTGPAPHWLAAA